jgi:hypothetical protein
VTKTSIRFSSSDAKDDWTETALDSEKCPWLVYNHVSLLVHINTWLDRSVRMIKALTFPERLGLWSSKTHSIS